jgi:molybdenum cofactor guanylyltransferase
MGRDKALLPLPGSGQETFLEHIVTVLTPLCHEVMLVARDDAQAAAYAQLVPAHVRIVTDRIPDSGPLMGLYSGLSAIQSSHALVMAVDMPFIQPGLVSFLLAQPLDEAIILPIVQENPQVMLAVYPRSILPIVEKCLEDRMRGPRALLQKVPVCYVEEARLREIDPQLRSFVNINRPEELQEF